MPARPNGNPGTCIFECVNVRARAYLRPCVCVCVCRGVFVRVRACMNVHVYTWMHSYAGDAGHGLERHRRRPR